MVSAGGGGIENATAFMVGDRDGDVSGSLSIGAAILISLTITSLAGQIRHVISRIISNLSANDTRHASHFFMAPRYFESGILAGACNLQS